MQTRPKPGSDCPVSMALTPWRGLCTDNRDSVTTYILTHNALQYDKGDARSTLRTLHLTKLWNLPCRGSTVFFLTLLLGMKYFA